jgi:hypothetical protein
VWPEADDGRHLEGEVDLQLRARRDPGELPLQARTGGSRLELKRFLGSQE